MCDVSKTCAAIALASLLAMRLAAQAPVAITPGAPVCPAGREPAIDSSVQTVAISAGTAWNRRTFTDADRKRILFYADAIRQRFVPPPSLGAVPTLAEVPLRAWGGTPTGHSAVDGKLVLVVKRNGRLREAFWQVLPFSREFSRAVFTAAIVADTSHDFDGIPEPEAGRVVDDTLVVQLRSVRDEPGDAELPLMRVQLVAYVPEAMPREVKRGPLTYPQNAAWSNVENEGEMQVLVGSDGRAVMNASQITRIDWRDFMNTMRYAVEKSVFAPATSNGCAVPALTVVRFKFALVRP